MRKILRNIFLNNFKNIFFLLTHSKSKYFELSNIELKIKKNCKLGKKNSILTTRIDQIITPNILKNGEWESFTIKFIQKHIKNKKYKFDFVDIGANIGLTTKQLINEKRHIKRFYCIEPEKKNFSILKKNFLNYNNIAIYNFALIDKKKKINKIYINENNFGDYSLLNSLNKKSSIIKTVNINNFFKKITLENKISNIIYKSDTQGFDEMLLLSLKKIFFKKINILIIEISNFNFLNKNKLKFFNLINNFNIIEDENGKRISKKKLIKKINKRIEFNLFLAKN